MANKSFFDWEQQFRTKPTRKNPKNNKNSKKSKDRNSLGVDEDVFKQLMKAWRRKNLSHIEK